MDVRPTRRQDIRASDLDGNELVFSFTIAKKLYRCPGCRDSIDVGSEHTLVRYLSAPSGAFHQHWHRDCANERFRRELRNVRMVPR